MLGKLIKHEFKATWRTFIPIYAGLAVLTTLACIFLQFVDQYTPTLLKVGAGFGMVIFIFGFVFVIISPYIFLSMRFYRTTCTREAYLTFTIPADSKLILLAKLISGSIWTFATIILWFVALATFTYAADPTENMWSEIIHALLHNAQPGLLILEIFSFVVGIVCSLLSIFAAISLSQLVRDHRVIASLAFYAAIYTVQQIVSCIILAPYLISELTTSGDLSVGYATGFSAELVSGSNASGDDIALYLISVAVSLAFSIGFFFLSNHMMKKKLNLL